MKICLTILVMAGICAMTRAETITITSTADTGMHESAPDHNLGANTFFPSGSTGQNSRSRGLIKFDVSGLPADAVIDSVILTLQVTLTPAFGSHPSTFELRRVLQFWGEGRGSGNLGVIAQPGEATWQARLYPDTLWSAPGGAIGTDFAAAVSSSNVVDAIGSYDFPSSAQMIADVSLWRSNATQNFGWALLSQDENVAKTARRFGSHEDVINKPLLKISYHGASASEVRITGVTRIGNAIQLGWTGGTAPFQVLISTNLMGNWNAFGAPVNGTNTSVNTDLPFAFFKIQSQ